MVGQGVDQPLAAHRHHGGRWEEEEHQYPVDQCLPLGEEEEEGVWLLPESSLRTLRPGTCDNDLVLVLRPPRPVVARLGSARQRSWSAGHGSARWSHPFCAPRN